MRSWNAHQLALAAGVQLLRDAPATAVGPDRATIDSRTVAPGELFVGLPGQRADGGRFGAAALSAGAWGVLVAPAHADSALSTPGGAVLVTEDPLAALQRLANAWRRELDCVVIGVTGSTGKTSTKELLLRLLAPHRRTVASQANFNTEIGMPLQVLAAPADTQVLVLEMAMRGAGQIAELARIAEPDVGVIVSIGPVHLELLGSIEAIAAAKAELIAGLAPGATAVVPAGERLLTPHLRADLQTVSFGRGGRVQMMHEHGDRLEIDAGGDRIELEVNFSEAHLRVDLLAAVAAACAVGVRPSGRVELTLSAGRGQRRLLPGEVTLIDDSYNANPDSMRAALDALAATPAVGRRLAVLGDMLELGPEAPEFHREVGAYADGTADVLVSVGPLAAAMLDRFSGERHSAPDAESAAEIVSRLVGAGDVVLVKGSNGVRLSLVCERLLGEATA